MQRYGFPFFFRLVGKTIFKSKGTFARLTPQRAATMAVFIPTLFFTQVVHRIALRLDDVFFPGYRDVVVKQPMFMVGIPRSGTTFLHRLVSKDTENFTTMTTWEMVLAPSIIERKFFRGLGVIDRALGGFGKRLVHKVEDRAFASVRKIHKIGLYDPEEDDITLFPIFCSMFMLFAFPFPEEMMPHARFDVDLSKDERDAIMGFYKGCVQRHMYVHGTEKRFLSKNPMFSGKVDTLAEFFPDAHIICNVRSPYDALPSLLSFVSFPWGRYGNDMKGMAFYDMMLDIVGFWYRHPAERLPALGEERYRFVPYDDLIGDLEATLMDLYEHCALSVGAQYAKTLEVELAKARAYKSKHKYHLSDYGLSAERILTQFRDVFERFELSTEYTSE